MENNMIPITIEHNQNSIVGSVVFTEDFENILLEALKNHISLKIGGVIDLNKNKLISLSIFLNQTI